MKNRDLKNKLETFTKMLEFNKNSRNIELKFDGNKS